jgi:hypothetical protein
MTSAEFIELANQQTDAELLGPCLHDDSIPYVFEPEPAKWNEFREFLAPKLNIAPADIRIVGSGRFGFSMNPTKNFKNFGDRSDIDVVIVNSNIFDSLWLSLLRAAYWFVPRFRLAEASFLIHLWVRVQQSQLQQV